MEGLATQLHRDSGELAFLDAELENLRTAHTRFREVEEISRPKQERVDIIAALLLNLPQRVRPNKTGDVSIDPDEAEGSPLPVSVPLNKLKPSAFPLWKIIREVVRQTSEIQVVKLEKALKEFGIVVRRQTIESALATHKKDFRITWRGREKFISLK
jgi:hypothetical protein